MKKFPISLFPDHFFPDVDLREVELTSNILVIKTAQGEWALGPKLTFFEGAGSMHFTYAGVPQIRWSEGTSSEWHYVTNTEILAHMTELFAIYSKPSAWEFYFASKHNQHRIEVILPQVSVIGWDGPGEDIEDPEE